MSEDIKWITGKAPIVLDIDESCIVHARTVKTIDKKEVKSQVMDYKYIINQGPAKHKFTITAEDDGIASIIPEGEIEVNEGESITFNIIGTPDHPPYINNIDGIRRIGGRGISSYTFEDVNSNHNIDIVCVASTWPKNSIVTPHAYEGGSISPNKETEIQLNTPTTFTITTNRGYEIDKVLIDGHNVGAVSEYTFTFTELEFHLIEAFFKKAEPATTYTVTSSCNEGGTIDPSGESVITEGEIYTLEIVPDDGYSFSVIDNDVDVNSHVQAGGKEGQFLYVIESVNEDHIIVVSFKSK